MSWQTGILSPFSRVKPISSLRYPQHPVPITLRTLITTLPSGFRDLAWRGLISMELLLIIFRQYNWQQAFKRVYNFAKSSPASAHNSGSDSERELAFVLEYEPLEDVVSLSLILKLLAPGDGMGTEPPEDEQSTLSMPFPTLDAQFEASLCQTLILHTLAIWEPTHGRLTPGATRARLAITQFLLENRGLLLPQDLPLSVEAAARRDCLVWMWIVVAEFWKTVREPRAGDADKGIGLMADLLQTAPRLQVWEELLELMRRFYCFEILVGDIRECWLDALNVL